MNPKTGICDDSQANCFIDPCDVPDACGEGQKCKANYCGGCHAICSGDPGIATATTATKPATPATFPLDDGSTCEPNAACSSEGSTCASGTETCCGQTFNSMECVCENTFEPKQLPIQTTSHKRAVTELSARSRPPSHCSPFTNPQCVAHQSTSPPSP